MHTLPAQPAYHKPIRVAIVDDSAAMRSLIRSTLESAETIKVIGEAADPYAARDMIKATSPDVVTLDIEMPRMNGIDFLRKIMSLRPMPVIMISSLTKQGSAASIEALALGAVDCVGKPNSQYPDSLASLPDKIIAAAKANVQPRVGSVGCAAVEKGQRYDSLIALGASTGGVDALLNVVTRFPEDCPPTVIVQHMPGSFTTTFASRLNSRSAIRVVEAEDGMTLQSGCAYLAPGSTAHLEVVGSHAPRCRLTTAAPRNGHRPSVDVLLQSLTNFAPKVVGAVLTGMGRDGADGLRLLRDLGCPTLVQDEASSVVFGMPKAALANKAADDAYPIDKIAEVLLAHARSEVSP